MGIIDKLKKSVRNTITNTTEEIKDFKISEDERNARLDTCKSCEFYLSTTTQCKKCGCFMPLKTWLKNSSCPMDKW